MSLSAEPRTSCSCPIDWQACMAADCPRALVTMSRATMIRLQRNEGRETAEGEVTITRERYLQYQAAEAEVERWHDAYVIAHDQAMENGTARLAAEARVKALEEESEQSMAEVANGRARAEAAEVREGRLLRTLANLLPFGRDLGLAARNGLSRKAAVDQAASLLQGEGSK